MWLCRLVQHFLFQMSQQSSLWIQRPWVVEVAMHTGFSCQRGIQCLWQTFHQWRGWPWAHLMHLSRQVTVKLLLDHRLDHHLLQTGVHLPDHMVQPQSQRLQRSGVQHLSEGSCRRWSDRCRRLGDMQLSVQPEGPPPGWTAASAASASTAGPAATATSASATSADATPPWRLDQKLLPHLLQHHLVKELDAFDPRLQKSVPIFTWRRWWTTTMICGTRSKCPHSFECLILSCFLPGRWVELRNVGQLSNGFHCYILWSLVRVTFVLG